MDAKKILINAALAGLVTGAALPMSADPHSNEGKCFGVNSCKGTGECGGKGHSCAGQNSCKGQGWLKMTEKDCKAKGGKFEPGTGM